MRIRQSDLPLYKDILNKLPLDLAAQELGLTPSQAYNLKTRFLHTDKTKERVQGHDNMEIIELLDNVGVRAYNALKRAGIDSISQLRMLSLDDLLGLEHMTEDAARQVVEALNKYDKPFA